ncbi:MAG: ATP-dependent DNA helicase [Thermoplasmatales archaeon]
MGTGIKSPYELYRWQVEALDFLKNSKSKIKILESPTGSGKTLVSLIYALEDCDNCKIVFLTRTNSQVENVFRESRLLGLKKVISFMGRGETCLFKKVNPEMREGDPEEQSRLCQRLVKDRMEGKEGCFYETDYDMGWVADIMRPQDLVNLGDQFGFCPYFAQRELLKDAKVVVSTYSYLLSPYIRERFMDWIETPMEKIIVIFDEAHNVPEFLRMINSASFSVADINKARDEVEKYGDKTFNNLSLSLSLNYIEEALEYIFSDGPRILTPDDAKEAFMKSFSSGTIEISRLLEQMVYVGEGIKEMKLNEGKLPRSYIYRTAVLSQLLMEDSGAEFVRIVDDSEQRINLRFLDVSNQLNFLKQFKSVLFISGTLTPFEKFKDELGIEEANERAISVPYLESNLRVLYTDEVNLSYYKRLESEEKLLEILVDFINRTSYNTMVLATSYEQLSKIRDLNFKRKIYFERKNITNLELADMIESFKQNGGVLMGVINGRLSEGLDLPGKFLEVAIIAGIPYPKPSPETNAMETYYDMKFKKGWYYAYEAVAIMKLKQALGRLIRSPNDRGVAIILDSRAKRFKKALPNLYRSENLVEDTVNFLNQ